MPYPMLAVVRLRTDDQRVEGVAAWAIGAIVEVYDGAYEVEFADPADETTIALLTLAEDEVEAAPVEEQSGRASG